MSENCKGEDMYYFSEIINKIPLSSLSWDTDRSSATPQKKPRFYVTKKLIIVFTVDLHWFYSEPAQSSLHTQIDLSYFQIKV